MLCRYFHSIKNRVKTSVLNEPTNIIRLVSLVSVTFSLERERVLLKLKYPYHFLLSTINKRMGICYIKILRSCYLVQRPAAPQGSTSPSSDTGSPISFASTLPPNFDTIAVLII